MWTGTVGSVAEPFQTRAAGPVQGKTPTSDEEVPDEDSDEDENEDEDEDEDEDTGRGVRR